MWVVWFLLACALACAFCMYCCCVLGGEADELDKRLFEAYLKQNKGGEDDGDTG